MRGGLPYRAVKKLLFVVLLFSLIGWAKYNPLIRNGLNDVFKDDWGSPGAQFGGPGTLEDALRRQNQLSKEDGSFVHQTRSEDQINEESEESEGNGDVDPPQPDFVEGHSHAMKMLDLDSLGPDLYHLSPENQTRFFEFKEEQYAKRREHLNEYCNVIRALYDPGMKNPMMDISPHCILYDKPDGISHCSIAKVASTTWCRHFINLAGVDPQDVVEQFYVKHLWPLPKNVSVEQSMAGTLSFVIIRNPLSRLASVYYEKFLDININPRLIEKGIKLAGRKRPLKPDKAKYPFPEDDPFYPSPTEFLNFIIDDFRKVEKDDLNYHWRPQHGSCPFCRFNFTVYAKMEELHEDTAYILLKTNLTSKIKHELHKNTSKSGGKGNEKERRFWSRVRAQLIKKMFDLYYLDSILWGYTLKNYLHDLDLDEKFQEIV